jgi:hypothetical protein
MSKDEDRMKAIDDERSFLKLLTTFIVVPIFILIITVLTPFLAIYIFGVGIIDDIYIYRARRKKQQSK